MSSDPSAIDTTTAHPARRHNYWLGGKDNFAADRASADEIEKAFPGIRTAALQNRQFLHRVVRDLVIQEGIRQFLDIGTGLPTADNTHEIAQRLDPTCRIVYVDNDPLVLVHARALLTSHPNGAANYLQADLRNPEQILSDPALTATLDLSQPTALLLVAVLHFLPDTDQALAAVRTLMDHLAPGSYLVISHASYDLLPAATTDALHSLHPASVGDFTPRSRTQIDRFFDRLATLPPGLQLVSEWRPATGSDRPPPHDVAVYGAVARKP
jgi:SAM-dependent methyltransferase